MLNFFPLISDYSGPATVKDAKTEVQGLESYIAAEQDCWVSVGKALCELCAAAEFPRVDQKVESGLHFARTKGMEAFLEGIQNWGCDEEFLTSCEAEPQELMKQIDIMVAHKKSEWEGHTHALQAGLDIRERELKTLRSQLDTNHKEVKRLTDSSS